MFLFGSFVFALLLVSWLVTYRGSRRTTFECPRYQDIADSSMANFDMDETSGIWYMLATTEPTMPFFCTCAVMNYSVFDTWYMYTGNYTCLGKNVSLDSIGQRSMNPDAQGFLLEAFSLFHKPVTPLRPYYIFSISRDGNDLKLFHSYACVNTQFNMYSYNILSRTPYVSRSYIKLLVDSDKAKYEDVFDFSHLRFMDEDAYVKCGVVPP